jgi:hypothetical protein
MARHCDKCIHWVKHPSPEDFPMACQIRIDQGSQTPGVKPHRRKDKCDDFLSKNQLADPLFSLEEILACSK